MKNISRKLSCTIFKQRSIQGMFSLQIVRLLNRLNRTCVFVYYHEGSWTSFGQMYSLAPNNFLLNSVSKV